MLCNVIFVFDYSCGIYLLESVIYNGFDCNFCYVFVDSGLGVQMRVMRGFDMGLSLLYGGYDEVVLGVFFINILFILGV